MCYYKEELLFELDERERVIGIRSDADLLGLEIKLGNRPLVTRIDNLAQRQGKAQSPFSPTQDIYAVVHAIGALRTKGRAHVEELQYYASYSQPSELRTIDLIPSTQFKEVFSANITLEGGLRLNGNVETTIPKELASALSNDYLSLGGDLKVQLSNEASFVGKFSYSLTYPVSQSTGIATNGCTWILKPDGHRNKLLGDQLMVQFLAVPKGTDELHMHAHAVVKADRGLLWRRQEQKTKVLDLVIPLQHSA